MGCTSVKPDSLWSQGHQSPHGCACFSAPGFMLGSHSERPRPLLTRLCGRVVEITLFLSNVPPPSVPHNNSCQWALGSSQGLCRTRCDLDRICLLGDDPLSAAGVGTEQEEAGIHQSWLPSGHLWPQGCCPLVAPAEVGGGLLPSSERHCAGWVEMSHRPPPPASAQWDVVADCPQCPVRAPPL